MSGSAIDTPTGAWQRRLLQSDLWCSDKEFILGGHTFAEVYAMAQSLRDLFTAAHGDEGEKIVCLAAENKAVIAAAILASLAGGPTLLLPFAFSGRALAEMRAATGFTSAVTDKPRDLPPGTRVFCPRPGSAWWPDELPPIEPKAELLRLFTGGSTGMPKSWSKTADNLFAEAFYLKQQYRISAQDRLVATVSPYHIYGLLFSILVPLISSAAVFAGTPSFPNEISEAVMDNAATVLISVPAHYRVLRGRRITAGSLRLAFSSAGMLPRADNEEFCRRNQVPLTEIYGSTETGGIAVRVRDKGEEAFTPFKTVDWQRRHENLYVRSAYISADVRRDKNGFFAANDRIERGPGNSFFLKGRSDAVTKVGGKRVNLEEIRDKIKVLPGVDDCLVITLAVPGGRESMIAALIVGEAVDLQELKKNIAARLEPYARPRLIRKTDKLPLTAAGKYDLALAKRLLD
ncbi:MAG TPA: acyl-CoA synthetase [Desulfobacterales bacterium]|nr:acyl-CoA synthetase [Desulfobacterales bacterium]